MINRLHFHPDLLNGHPQNNKALADIHPPLFHKMILIPPIVLRVTVRMTVLTRHQYHPRHVDVLHPLLRLPVVVNPGEIMTPKQLAEA